MKTWLLALLGVAVVGIGGDVRVARAADAPPAPPAAQSAKAPEPAKLPPKPLAADAPLPQRAREALDRAAGYYHLVAVHGGYVWTYSPDLQQRWGEGKASATQIWVQPPGTPSVGMAFLRAWEVTGNPRWLADARNAADALAYGQLESGGWTYSIDFDPKADRSLRRALVADGARPPKKLRNVTTFDDDTTQSAVRFLLAVVDAAGPAGDVQAPAAPAADRAGAKQSDAKAVAGARGDDPAAGDPADRNGAQLQRIRSALDYALRAMLRAQHENGAFPQGYDGSPRRVSLPPAARAKAPADGVKAPREKEYWWFYTLNDNTHADCIRTLVEAHRRTGKAEYLDAARKAGNFLVLAQLPDPQAAWAQQYNFNMEPAWARKFEPPAVCTSESAGVIRMLVDLYLYTGDDKFLAPIPAAAAWLERSRRPDGQWARFYELGTNRPLYFTKDYRLTYEDTDMPTHYAFVGTYGIESAISYYRQVKEAGREKWLAAHPDPAKAPKPEQAARRATGMEKQVRAVIDAMDDLGRWLNDDGRIDSRLFVHNTRLLCDYIEAESRK